MTCIAIKGNILAADTQLSHDGGFKGLCRKLYPIKGNGCLAIAGDVDAEWWFIKWFIAGSKVDDYPKDAKKFSAIHITEFGEVRCYWGAGPTWLRIDHPFHAIGIGSDMALALMHVGFDAKTACEVVGEVQQDCNSLVDTYNIKTGKLTLSKWHQPIKRINP